MTGDRPARSEHSSFAEKTPLTWDLLQPPSLPSLRVSCPEAGGLLCVKWEWHLMASGPSRMHEDRSISVFILCLSLKPENL